MALRAAMTVAAGSALGAVLRQLVGDAYGLTALPWATLTVNAAGSLAIGGITALTAPGGRFPTGPRTRLFLTGGVCGGFTTFSVFSLDTLALVRAEAWGAATANLLATLGLCLAGVAAGRALALRMRPARHH